MSGPKSFDPSAVSPGLISKSRNSTLPPLSRGVRPFPLPKKLLFSFKVPFVCADCIISVYWPGGTSSNSKLPLSSVTEYLTALYCSGFPLVPSAVLLPTKVWPDGISTRPFRLVPDLDVVEICESAFNASGFRWLRGHGGELRRWGVHNHRGRR
jgi:hypothetical protein